MSKPKKKPKPVPEGPNMDRHMMDELGRLTVQERPKWKTPYKRPEYYRTDFSIQKPFLWKKRDTP